MADLSSSYFSPIATSYSPVSGWTISGIYGESERTGDEGFFGSGGGKVMTSYSNVSGWKVTGGWSYSGKSRSVSTGNDDDFSGGIEVDIWCGPTGDIIMSNRVNWVSPNKENSDTPESSPPTEDRPKFEDTAMYEALKKLLELNLKEVNTEKAKVAFEAFLQVGAKFWMLQAMLAKAQKLIEIREWRIAALRLRLEQLTRSIEPKPLRVWCADLTEDLTGKVDTIEVNGAPLQILVGPGGRNELQQDGSAGKLCNIMAMSSAQAALAWALLPGWQKWRPTYRVGTITAIDYEADTATVILREPVSVAQGLNINQSNELKDISVEYMECNAKAFVIGDDVMVEFQGQEWESDPTVIGFETNPQPCSTGDVFVCGSNDWENGNLFAPGKVLRIESDSGDVVWTANNNIDAFIRTVAAAMDGVYCGSLNAMDPDITSRGALVKYDIESGNIVWSKNGLWGVSQVAAGKSGVYVGSSYTTYDSHSPGYPNTYNLTFHAKLTKYGHDGTERWERTWQYSTNSGLLNGQATHYGVAALVVDEYDDVYVGGIGTSGESFRKLGGQFGNIVWEINYDIASTRFRIGGATMGRDGYVYAKTTNGMILQFPTGIHYRSPITVNLNDYRYVATNRRNLISANVANSENVMLFDEMGRKLWEKPVGMSVYQVAMD